MRKENVEHLKKCFTKELKPRDDSRIQVIQDIFILGYLHSYKKFSRNKILDLLNSDRKTTATVHW